MLNKIVLCIGVLMYFFSPNLAQTPCVGGMAGIYPCDNIDLLAHMPINTIGGVSAGIEGSDIWGWTDPLNNKEYALVGLSSGTSFVDITNPTNPLYLGFLPTASSNSAWRDIKVYNNYAYIVSEAVGHGVQVFDLTQLRSIASPPMTFTASAFFTGLGGTGRAHNIVVDETTGFFYLVGNRNYCGGGLVIINTSNPATPVLDGCFDTDGYTHDAMCFTYQGPDVEHFGKEICIASNEDTQTIIDITDKSDPEQLSRTGYAGRQYTHQGWVTDDHKYLLFDDETDERNNNHNTRTYMMDISNLDAPIFMGYFESSIAAIDHNLYVKGEYAYQSNYRAGLRILNLRDIGTASLSEVAYFDTYPSSNSSLFNGAWSVYPYFKSGNVIIGDIESGLFIVRPTLPHFTLESAKTPTIVCPGQDIVYPIDLTAYAGYSDMVTLSVTGMPAGVTATFGTNPIAANGSTTLTISNTTGTTGAYRLAVIGKGPADNSIHNIGLAFKLLADPIEPSLTFPTNGMTNVPESATLLWSGDADTESYDIEISTDIGFGTIVQTATGITTTSYTTSSPLDANTSYYWRVKGVNMCGEKTTMTPFEFTTTTVLPIDLLEFAGYYEDRQVRLNWSTATEWNNNGFEILKSLDGLHFEKIAWVAGQGNSFEKVDYVYWDKSVENGEIYHYQLRQIDDNGLAKLSAIIVVKILDKKTTISLVPNPAKSYTNLQVISSKVENLTIQIMDISGRVIQEQALETVVGKNEFTLDMTTWSSGIYWIRVQSGTTIGVLKMVKL